MGDKSDEDVDELDYLEKIKELEREKEKLERRNLKKKHAELSRSVGQLRKAADSGAHTSSRSPVHDKNHPNRGNSLQGINAPTQPTLFRELMPPPNRGKVGFCIQGIYAPILFLFPLIPRRQ